MTNLQNIGLNGKDVQIQSMNSNANDVTSQYVDSAARHSSLVATRKSLMNVMAEATTTRDVMEVQRELSQVTQQIESQKQSMNYFSKGAALSSIHVRISEEKPVGITIPEEDFEYDDNTGNDDVVKRWSPLKTIKKACKALGELISTLLDSLIYAVVIGVPVLGAVWVIQVVVLNRRSKGSREFSDNAV